MPDRNPTDIQETIGRAAAYRARRRHRMEAAAGVVPGVAIHVRDIGKAGSQ
jgi:hypothetical protein